MASDEREPSGDIAQVAESRLVSSRLRDLKHSNETSQMLLRMTAKSVPLKPYQGEAAIKVSAALETARVWIDELDKRLR